MKKLLMIITLLLIFPSIGLGFEAVTAPVIAPVTGPLTAQLDRDWTLRPSVNLSVMMIDLRSGDFSAGLIPGAGYGLDWKNKIGFDMYADFLISRNEEPDSIGLSFLLSVMKYFSAGVMIDFRDGREPRYSLILGGGLSLSTMGR